MNFSSLKIQTKLLENLASLDYASMTPIQAQSLPIILDGKDVIGQGKTGSGKTAAFGIGILEKLDVKNFNVQSLVVCPTRELADQVAKEIRRLARAMPNIKVLTITGGAHFGSQISSIKHGVHIVVGTPGRIEDHLQRNTLQLDAISMLVLDEADRMLDMGFQETLDKIIAQMPTNRQTLLFSATFPEQIARIATRIMQQPEIIKVASTHDKASIEQHFYQVKDNRGRMNALRLLLLANRPQSALVFCNTKKETQAAADELHAFGFSVLALHGDLEQRDRDQTLLRFANKSVAVLMATDVAARGLDIDSLDAVINYHIANDPEVHIHRIGRTGRAGNKGKAYSLYSEDEFHKVALLAGDFDPVTIGESLPSDSVLDRAAITASMATLHIDGGKKQKIRAGDILGALTGKNGIAGNQVGKIDIFDRSSYVAVGREVLPVALDKLSKGKLKGKSFRVWRLRD